MTRVADLMTWEPLVSVRRSTAVGEAVSLAAGSGIHHLLVMRGDELVGVLCTCDMHGAPRERPVSECMSKHIVTIEAADHIVVAADRMRRHRVGSLPVVSAGRVIGIVTASDLVRFGLAPAALGKQPCAACGSIHHVTPLHGLADVGFCAECMERSPDDEIGGSD
jgi:acetoin utilization protein AcuB